MTTEDNDQAPEREPDHNPGSDESEDAWGRVTHDFATLGNRVRSFFEARDGDARSAEKAQESIQELVDAAERAGRNISAAFRDEQVQAQAKTAMTSLIEAIGTSAKDLTDRINIKRDEPDDV